MATESCAPEIDQIHLSHICKTLGLWLLPYFNKQGFSEGNPVSSASLKETLEVSCVLESTKSNIDDGSYVFYVFGQYPLQPMSTIHACLSMMTVDMAWLVHFAAYVNHPSA